MKRLIVIVISIVLWLAVVPTISYGYTSKVSKLSNTIHTKWGRPSEQSEQIARAIFKVSAELKTKLGLLATPEEIAGICAQETGFNPSKNNGLMQVTSVCRRAIAKDWGVSRYRLKAQSRQIEQSIRMGSYYYAKYKKKYNKDMALVVYNHGFNKSKRHLVSSRGRRNSYLNKVNRYIRYFGGVINDKV